MPQNAPHIINELDPWLKNIAKRKPVALSAQQVYEYELSQNRNTPVPTLSSIVDLARDLSLDHEPTGMPPTIRKASCLGRNCLNLGEDFIDGSCSGYDYPGGNVKEDISLSLLHNRLIQLNTDPQIQTH